MRLVLYAPSEAVAFEAASAAFSRIAELEAIMSDYRPDSELMRLSNRPHGQAIPISADFFTVLAQAQALARSSDGAFDVTVGPLVHLWRQARRSGTLPDPDALHEARQRVGWQHLHLDSTQQTVRLDRAGMRLDLGGIAKGYAAEQALDVLRRHGVTRALIEIGGDLAVSDAPPDREGWVVEVPNAPDDQRRHVLTHAAVSSSGDTEQFVEIDGTRYSHIVDPRTGLGLTHRVAVTVIGPNAFLSDGLSTTLSTLGPEAGRAYLDTYHPEYKAYFRQATREGDEG